MKAKIFAKLKQEYSSLGLGDEYLMSKAESLAATGLVTDDNTDAVVACQRKELEGLQKANDKRVTDALEKERKKHEEETRKKEKEAEEARRKAEEDAKKNKPGEDTPPTNDYEALRKQMEDIMAANKKRDDDHAALIKELTDKNTELGKTVKDLTDKNAASEAAAAKAARNAMIQAKAKELGVPQWRIEEGFNLAEDASDEIITETLTKVANNINTNLLPGTRNVFPISGNEPTKDEISAMAASLVK